jgi:S1/P1 Nuclease
MRFIGACLGAVCIAALNGSPAHAWGDEGHEVIGLIADHYLKPAVRARVNGILAEDDSGLVLRDIAHESTWADKYRDSDRGTSKLRYRATRDWHFVDLELAGMDLERACHGRPPLPPGTDASQGPADDCVVDKIDEFIAELKNPAISDRERRLALQFLLHLVGDVHQPLHASDDYDQGGNRKFVSPPLGHGIRDETRLRCERHRAALDRCDHGRAAQAMVEGHRLGLGRGDLFGGEGACIRDAAARQRPRPSRSVRTVGGVCLRRDSRDRGAAQQGGRTPGVRSESDARLRLHSNGAALERRRARTARSL